MSRRLYHVRVSLTLASLFATCVCAHAASADKEFKGNNGNGNASNADNFLNTNNGNTSNNPPGRNDRVKVDKTIVDGLEIPLSIDLAQEWGSLEFLGGKITGSQGLTLINSSVISSWTGGEFSTVTFNIPSLTIGTGTNAKKVSNGAKLNLTGTTTWNADDITTGGSSELNNVSGATFTATGSGKIGHDPLLGGNRATFKNDGTFTKSTSIGTTEIEAIFNNYGVVNVNTGTLKLKGGGTSSGTLTAAAGMHLELGGGFAVIGGTIDGGGTAVFSGNGTWSGGRMIGTGITKIEAGTLLEISGTGNKQFSRADGNGSGGRTIDNSGTVTVNGTGSLLGGDGAQLINRAGSTFDLQTDTALGHNSSGNLPTFSNSGTFKKSGGMGTVTVSGMPFANAGSVDVQSGSLAFSSEVTSHAGKFNANAGNTLTFSGGQTFNHGTEFTGSGRIEITGGTTTVGGNLTASNLVFAGGTLQGSANVTGTLEWNSGTFAGTGTLTSKGQLNISGADNKVLARADGNGSGGRTIENTGTTTWTGAGALLGGDGARIVNDTTGVFLAQNDSTMSHNSSGNQPTFDNRGTFRKTIGTGNTTFSGMALLNSGLVDVQTGSLQLESGVTSSGTFNTAANTSIVFKGGQSFTDGSKFNGTGAIRVAGGDTFVSGNLTAQTLEFAAGNLDGSATLDGTVSWTGGRWRGTGVAAFTSTSALTLGGPDDKTIARADGNGSGGRIVRSAGSMVWKDAGKIIGNEGAGIDVQSGGVFEVQAASAFQHGGSGDLPFLANSGTVRKTAGSGATTFAGVAFTNHQRVEILGGSLDLTGGGGLSNHGMFQVQAGTVTSSAAGGTSNGGTFDVWHGGKLRFTGGTNTISGATFTGAGATEIAGGTLIVSGTGATTVSSQFALSSGTIGGVAQLLVGNGGAFDWSGGQLTGTGTLKVAHGGRLDLTGAGSRTFARSDGNGSGGRTIDNAGQVNWSGAGSVLGGDGARFINQGGTGVVEITNNAAFAHNLSGDQPVFTNHGIVRKTAGGGLTHFATPFKNDGLLESQSGTVRLSGGGNGAGEFKANGGAIEFTSSFTLGDNASFTGAQATTLTGGTLAVASGGTAHVGGAASAGRLVLAGGTLDGAGTLAVGSQGHVDWSGAALRGTGKLQVNTGGRLEITGAVNHDFSRADGNGSGGRVIENFGTIAWSDGAVRGGDGAKILNQQGGVFEVTGDGSLSHNLSGDQPSFTNAGTFRKTGSSGGSTLINGMPFVSSGVVEVKQGTLRFDSAVTSNGGSFFADSGTTLIFAGGQRFNTSSSILGPGLVQAVSGATTLSGTLTLSTFEFAGGSLFGSATVDSGVVRWTGGDLRDSATLTINHRAKLEVTGLGNRDFARSDGNGTGGRIIDNRGHILWENAGDLRGGDGAQIINQTGATFEVRNDRTFGHTGSGNVGTLTNHGLFLKSAAAGTTTVAVPFINNSTGVVSVQSGTLRFTSTFTNANGSFHIAQGATLNVPGTFNLGVGAVSGGGTLQAGTVVAGGVLAPGSSAGTLNITGDLTLLATSTLLIELGGTAPGVTHDFVSVAGNAVVGGALAVSFINGFQASVGPADTFTILSAGGTTGVTGTFLNMNITNGQVFTADGSGSFQVNFGAQSVVLSNFVAVPEPSTYVLMGIGTLAVLSTLRRRKK